MSVSIPQSDLPTNSTDVHSHRKRTLVQLGLWGVTTGRGWLVHGVHAALQREALVHA